ncbi:unnamed protein product [Moneuplotes crassus]|uniref:Uncharacterized protein n=3 Tax=Euplotes crassus TaxID=5936 RepID=A0AAD1UMI2_EUPCR|nr:unnamed protein product [Moneuplotes crassus]
MDDLDDLLDDLEEKRGINTKPESKNDDLWGMSSNEPKPAVDTFGSRSNQNSARKPPSSAKADPWAVKKQSPVLEDDFNFGEPENNSVFDKGSPAGPRHMPTFGGMGSGNFGGSAYSKGSQRSRSRKKDDDDDEFDNLIDSVLGKDDKEEPEDPPSPKDEIDALLGEPDPGRRPRPGDDRPGRRNVPKHSSQTGLSQSPMHSSVKKMEMDQKKKALFGLSGSSEGRSGVQKLNFGARSQVSPDDGDRRIDHNQTTSSQGNAPGGNTSVIDSSPIGVLTTNKSRRMAKRKTPGGTGGTSVAKPANRSKTTDVGINRSGSNRFDSHVDPPPIFDNNNTTSTKKKPPRPASQNPPYLINQDDDDEDDEFERDDGESILAMMDAPDPSKARGKQNITPTKTKKPNIGVEDFDEDDIFSGEGVGYVPSTVSKNRQDDSKSRGKSEDSDEITPLSRGRKKMVTAGGSSAFQKGIRDSSSPYDRTDGNFGSYSNLPNPNQPNKNMVASGSVALKSSIGVLPVNKSSKQTLGDNKEKSIPLDDLTRAKLDLEEAREKTLTMEKRMKKEIDELKLEQTKDILNLESHYNKMLETHNREIKKLSDDMYLSIKQERDKLEMINKTELENKKKQNEIELARQKDIYSDQNSVFENQLKQQIELNKMLEQVKTSSSNIETTLTHLSEDKTRGIQLQIEECDKRERELADKLRNIQYETSETEKRILNTEKEIQNFRVKIEVIKQDQGREVELTQENLRQEETHYKRVVDETELKQQEAEINLQRINKEIQEKQAEYDDKINALELERKIVVSDRQNLFELIQMERSNQERKMGDLEQLDHEITQEELDYEQRRAEYAQREEVINEKYNQIKTRTDVYDEEKDKFEDEAMKVHQYSLMVQQESERIANFKSNFDSMRKELEQSRDIIAREKAVIKTEKMRHLEMMGELDTKQRALELVRSDYIKDRGDIAQQMWAIKRPLDFKVDIKPPQLKAFNPPDANLPSAPPSVASYMPIRKTRPISDYKRTRYQGSDFQTFLLKEKEYQLNIMSNLNLSDSIHDSMKRSGLRASNLSSGASPGLMFNTDKKFRAGDSFGSESSGSLKYMSKNLNI